MRMKCALVVLALVGSACGGSDTSNPPPPPPDPGFTCSIDSLSGTWRVHYVENDGACGPISDETVLISTFGAGCTVHSRVVSSDRCRIDYSLMCPTVDNQGTSNWVVSLQQTSATHLVGSGTVQVVHPVGVCRSTYDITATKL